MTINELRAASTAALDAARALHDKAKTENRDFNAAEQADYAAKMGEHRSFEDRARRETDLAEAAKSPLKVAGAETRGDATLGLTEGEVRDFSFLKLMSAIANPQDQSQQRAAAFELECASEAARKAGREGGEIRGFTIPQDVLRAPIGGERRDGHYTALGLAGREQRALSAGSATGGGNTVATFLLAQNFIDILRNRLSVVEAGATMLTDLIGNVAIPRQTAAATVSWVTEGAAAGSATGQTFDQVLLNPKTASCYLDVTRRLLLQSSIDVEAFVRQDIAQQLSIAIDYAALNGTGASGQPRGVLQTAGIGAAPAIGVNGGSMIWDNWVDLETTVATQNADAASAAYITNAVQRGKAKKSVQLQNTVGMPIWDKNEVNGYKAIASNQVPANLTKGSGTNLSAVLFGNFADLFIGMWGGLDLLVDPFTSSTTGSVRFVALQDVDVALRRLQSFAAIVDAS